MTKTSCSSEFVDDKETGGVRDDNLHSIDVYGPNILMEPRQ